MAWREQGTTVAHVQSPACLRVRGFCGAFPLHGQLLRGELLLLCVCVCVCVCNIYIDMLLATFYTIS